MKGYTKKILTSNMKYNAETKIECGSIILVPYRRHHVEKYHAWMSSEELRTLTASEPLTLEQEFDMQNSWYHHDDKCTFIILDSVTYHQTNDEIKSMIGDTNLYFNKEETGVAEAEIMIAEPDYRCKKRGWLSMLTMLRFGISHLNVKTYIAKVGETNNPSLCLFKRLGFHVTGHSAIFQEQTLTLEITKEVEDWIQEQTSDYKETLHPLFCSKDLK